MERGSQEGRGYGSWKGRREKEENGKEDKGSRPPTVLLLRDRDGKRWERRNERRERR